MTLSGWTPTESHIHPGNEIVAFARTPGIATKLISIAGDGVLSSRQTEIVNFFSCSTPISSPCCISLRSPELHIMAMAAAMSQTCALQATLFSSSPSLPSWTPTKLTTTARRIRVASTSSSSLVTTEQVGELEVEQRQKLFNRIAPMYDSLNDWLSLGQHRVWKRMAVSWSGVGPGDRALDICCGSGDVSFLLKSKVSPTGSVVGLDFAQEQLEVAAERELASTYRTCEPRIEWQLGDALALPFEEGSFDAVTMAYGLRNVASVGLALEEIYGVLKPGKKASVLDFNRSEREEVVGFQGWMLDHLVVPVASQFGMQEEYAYLKTSIARFPTGREQEKLAMEVGFAKAVHYELAGGLMGVLVLTK